MIEKYRAVLSEVEFGELRAILIAREDGQHYTAAVLGAVFLEAYLTRLCEELNAKEGGRYNDLNALIQRLRQFSNNPPPDVRTTVPDDIIKRSEEIQRIRNRIVHHTGSATRGDRAHEANLIWDHLEAILDWDREKRPKAEAAAAVSRPQAESRRKVFLSRAKPHTRRQEFFLESFQHQLKTRGFEPVEVVLTQYDQKDPLRKVVRTISECEAMIVVGLERSHAFFLRQRPGASKGQEDLTHVKYTSPWLHMEAAIASTLKLPVFVLCQKDLASEGIFDRSWNTYTVVELSADLPESCPELDDFFRCFTDTMFSLPQRT